LRHPHRRKSGARAPAVLFETQKAEVNFLNPLFWFAALAIGVPVWLHLRRKPETDVVHFSALRFLDDQPVPRAAPHRLRDVVLFLLRALAVLLLVAAFAWPYVKKAMSQNVTESTVYILDNTLSNQAGDGFQQARDQVLTLIGKAASNTQNAVIELTSQPRVIVGFGDSRADAESKLRALKPSFQRGTFLSVFSQANTLLAQSLGQKKRIVFFSDNQENQWSENVNTPPFLKGVEVQIETAGSSAPRANLALQQPEAARFFAGEKTVVNLSALLRRFGDVKNCTVTLRVNGQEIFQRDINFASEPNDIRLLAQWESDPALWVKGELSVDGQPDALAADNRLFFTLPPMKEGRVALLAQSPYLHTAFLPEVMRGHWTARVLQPSKLADEAGANLDCDVLLVEAGYLQSKDARDLMLRYLNNGHGVVLLLNRTSPLVESVLGDLGFSFEHFKKANPDVPQAFRYLALQHPIFAPFRSPDFGGASDVRVFEHARVASKSALPLIFSQNGDCLLFESASTKGKLLVSAFGFERAQTDWPVQLSFIPFLDSMLQYARGQKTAETLFEPGDIFEMELPSEKNPRQVVVRRGDQELSRFPVDANRRAQIRVPDEPGLFSVTFDNDPLVQNMIAVNPPPKESELNYATTPQALTGWTMPVEASKQAASEAAQTVEATTRAAIFEQRFWWWLLLAGAAMLAAEMVALLFRRTEA
jgi:hypothetical protein